MFMDASAPVNEIGAISLENVEQPYIEPISFAVPAPGEDGEQQSISPRVLDICLILAAIGAVIAWWPLLQAYRP